MKYENLFSPIKLGKRTVKNRIVYSPTGENLAYSSGEASERMRAYYMERARGGAGIIMLGAVTITNEGKSHCNAVVMDRLNKVGGMKRLAQGIHSYGALVMAQLQHAGARTNSENIDGLIPRCVSDVDPETPSIVASRKLGPQQVLTTEELDAMPDKYVRAAVYCKKAEIDGVEIHMAHSFLLNQLLSPDTNKRTDKYGGSLENRMRLPVAIVKAVRAACGPDFIIGARIPGAEYVKNGLTADEVQKIAVALEEAGCNVISVSVGMTVDQTKIREAHGTPQGARLSKIANVKNAVSIPVMGSGTFREPEFCDQVIREGKQDFILMARQLICEPHWAKKVLEGKENEIRPCLTCNAACFDSVPMGIPIGCVLNPVTGNEFDKVEEQKSNEPKNIMIIGGGVTGMQAAITAAKKGHKVSVYEKEPVLAGQMNLACMPPDKEAVGKAAKWFAEETKRNGVDIYLEKEVTLDDVKAVNPDKVIYAAGAIPWVPPVPGIDKGIQAWDILKGTTGMPIGKKIAVIGGGLVGCETGLLMLQAGNEINIIEMMPEVAAGLESANREHLLRQLTEGNTDIYVRTKVLAIEDNKVICEKDGTNIEIEADMVVLAIGNRPYKPELAEEIKKAGFDVITVGDAVKPATFGEATKAGYLAASVL